MTHILIADDQSLFLDLLATLLGSRSDFRVIARACNGEEAVRLASKHLPDLCLLDIQMPGSSGLLALKKLKATFPDMKVVMLTTFGDYEKIQEAVALHADGYLLKDMTPAALILAIESCMAGLVCMHPSILHTLEQAVTSPPYMPTDLDLEFDEIDLEIIRCIGIGYANRRIAEHLNYSEGTIRNRISAILASTGLQDRTQIALFALRNHLV